VGFSVSAGVLGTSSDKDQYNWISTGNWGCGAFGGDLPLKSMLQWIASTMSGRSMRYFTFGEPDAASLSYVCSALRSSRITVVKLWRALLLYCKNPDDPPLIMKGKNKEKDRKPDLDLDEKVDLVTPDLNIVNPDIDSDSGSLESALWDQELRELETIEAQETRGGKQSGDSNKSSLLVPPRPGTLFAYLVNAFSESENDSSTDSSSSSSSSSSSTKSKQDFLSKKK